MNFTKLGKMNSLSYLIIRFSVSKFCSIIRIYLIFFLYIFLLQKCQKLSRDLQFVYQKSHNCKSFLEHRIRICGYHPSWFYMAFSDIGLILANVMWIQWVLRSRSFLRIYMKCPDFQCSEDGSAIEIIMQKFW